MKYCAYDAAGRILRSGSVPDEQSAINQAGPGEAVLIIGDDVDVTDTDHYVLNGALTAYTTAELATKISMPDGWTWQMPERVAVDGRLITEARTQAWGRIKAARAAAELAPFIHNGCVYDSNKEQIMGAVQMATLATMNAQPFSIDWTLHDNTVKTHAASEMIAVGVTLGARVSAIYDTGRVLRAQIADATTVTDIDAIMWPVS